MSDQKTTSVFNGTVTGISRALNCSPADLVRTTRLRADLKAESIDFVDIAFELEGIFDVRIDFRRLFSEASAAAGPAADITVGFLADKIESLIHAST